VATAQLAGGLGQYWFTGPSFGGMSGVNYALFGFVWMSDRYNRKVRYVISGGETVLLMVWFVACATGLLGPIANIGHAGGLVVGLLFGLPAFIRHLRAKGTKPELEDGSWAAVHLTGFRRFRRRVLDPYIPIWFLVLAAIVIAVEQPRFGSMPGGHSASCEVYIERVVGCLEQLGSQIDDVQMMTYVERLELNIAEMAAATDPDALTAVCEELLATLETQGLCARRPDGPND
jgi:hypothetical protein